MGFKKMVEQQAPNGSANSNIEEDDEIASHCHCFIVVRYVIHYSLDNGGGS